MAIQNPIKDYQAFLSALKVPDSLDYGLIQEAFEAALQATTELREESPVISRFGINFASLTLYICSEHSFYLSLIHI